MSHKTYRICLLSVVIIAVVVGIFYYLNYVQKESAITEGTLVHREYVADGQLAGADENWGTVRKTECIVPVWNGKYTVGEAV